MNSKSILQKCLDFLYWLLLFFSVPSGLEAIGEYVFNDSSVGWFLGLAGSIFLILHFVKRKEQKAHVLKQAMRDNLKLFEEEQKNGVNPSDGLNPASFDFLRRMDSEIDTAFEQKK
ncbi:MAG: hypothetical protein IJN61_01345 [Clostridia bacterium]|nr:hypothetical protein [Clostridia bacterium]